MQKIRQEEKEERTKVVKTIEESTVNKETNIKLRGAQMVKICRIHRADILARAPSGGHRLG